MLALLLVACTDPSYPDQLRWDRPDVVAIGASEVGNGLGLVVVTGSDLDHDGVSEWATVEFRLNEEWTADVEPVVRVYQEDAEIHHVWAGDHWTSWTGFGEELAVGDVDGDGFADLAIRAGTDEDTLRARVQLSTEAERKVEADPASGPGRVAGLAVVREDGDLVLASRDVAGVRIDRVALDGDPRVVDDDDRWLLVPYPPFEWVPQLGDTLAVDLDGDGRDDHLLFGTFGPSYEGLDLVYRGAGWLCPVDGAEGDCVQLGGEADLRDVGSVQAAGDVDGDGIAELVSSIPPRGLDSETSRGAVTIFRADGLAMAGIAGDGRGFGQAVAVVADDDGTPWLLVSRSNQVLGFRGAPLAGQWSTRDADRIWSTRISVTAIAPYRTRPDEPLGLLIGTGGGVYLYPFEP